MSLLLALTDVGGGTAYSDDLSVGAYLIVGQDVVDSVVSKPDEEIIGGGIPYKWKDKKDLPKYHPWIHHQKYVEEVEPEVIEAVIEVVAKTVEKRTIQDADLDTAKAEKALRDFLKQQEAEWKEVYSQLIRLEYERREQEYEDAQIAMLLFEM